MIRFFSCVLLFLFILSGCHVGPRYKPPTVPIPDDWKKSQTCSEEKEVAVETKPEVKIPVVDNWWEVFQDITLNELEVLAISNNPNLYIALDRILQARANAGITEADLYPQVNLNPSYQSTGQLFKIFLPPIPVTNGAVNPFGQLPRVFRIHQMQYGLLANVNYEIDLWGRLKDQYESAMIGVQVQEEAYYTTIITLTTDLASYYFQLRSLDAQIEMLKGTVESRRKSFDLTEKRFNKGLIAYADVAQASVELTNAESDYYESMRLRRLQENQIAVLIGVPASCFCIESIPLKEMPPIIPAGIPSEVLKRRPDIAQVERQMASQYSLVSSAYASFYPSVELTGALGFLSPDLKHFLSWKSRFWQIGVNVLQTIFDGGRKEANLDLALAQFYEARDNYKQKVLIAFREVEDALNDIEMQTKQLEKLRLSVEEAQKSARLSTLRYAKGVTNYLEVTVTERTLLDVQVNYLNVLGNRYLSTIQLIKALGGGWGCTECDEKCPATLLEEP